MKIKPVAGMLMALLLTSCNRVETPPVESIRPVKLLTVEDSARQGVRYFPARLKAGDEAQLAFRRAGNLQQLLVREGEQVKKGQLLAALDSTDQALRVGDREASYRLARTQYQRFATLYRQKAASRSELDIQQAQLDSALAELNIAREELGMTRIVAPFDGVIASVNVRNYQTVNPSQTIATLSSLETFDVVFSLPERLFNAIDINDRHYQPRVTLNSLAGREFPAVYKEHTTSTEGGSQTYQMTLSMKRPEDLPMLSGMSGSVRINFDALSGSRPAVIVIPVDAVFHAGADKGGQAQVWAIKDGSSQLQVEARDVQLGSRTAAGIEVDSGLHDGDRIVATGTAELRNGQTVRAWVRERGL